MNDSANARCVEFFALKRNEEIVIELDGEPIFVRAAMFCFDQQTGERYVRLGITAPKRIPIHRSEVQERVTSKSLRTRIQQQREAHGNNDNAE